MNKARVIDIRKTTAAALLLLGAGLVASTARAALRCDCSTIVNTCSASVSLDSSEIGIESSSKACSRVDYLIDGQPFAALVVDGRASFDMGGQPLTGSQIVVENCRVCTDNSLGNAVAANTAAAESGRAAEASDDEEGVRPIVKVMPGYPRQAWGAGREGRVSVRYDVSADGRVQNIRVIASSDPAFINATIDAMSRFRFEQGPAKDLKEEFYFRLVGGSEPTVTSNAL